MSLYHRTIGTVTVLLTAALSQPALAQLPALQGVTGVQISYKEPANPAHRTIYERLKNRQVLEQYKEFMSPLQLKRALNVALEDCGVVNAFHNAGKITYCYELVAEVQRQVAETNVLPGFRREDAIVGGFVNTLLHETGHAIFYLLDIPIFGREEDAADAIASYVSLQFGPTSARRVLTGTAFVWRAAELTRQKKRSNREFEDYSDEHGTDAQRFYNALCIAMGGDAVEKTKTFADFEQLLPANRRAKCAREYLHVKNSFAHFVLPHVDQDRMKKVRATEWLRNEDGSDIAPPPAFGPRSSPRPGNPGSQTPRPGPASSPK